MITAYASDIDKNRIAHCGFDGILHKPFNSSALLDKILDIFGKKREIREKEEKIKDKIKNSLYEFSKYKIMIVEDNEINRQITEEILIDEGLNAKSFENGKLAVDEYLQDGSYDLILMDLQMPVMDGYEATVKIREKDDSVPIIAMTADAIIGVSDKCFKIGMNDYISKPIDPLKMFETLSKWLKNLKIKYKSEIPSENYVFSESENIDFKKGLSIVAGDINTYRKILKKFLEDYCKNTEKIFSENLNAEEQKRALHTFKGVVGNIGATRLYETMREEEKNYTEKGNCNKELIFKQLRELEEDIKMFINVTSSKESTSKDESALNLTDEQIKEKIENLEKYLLDYDMEAKEIIEELYKKYRNNELFEEMRDKVDKFQFDEALKKYNELFSDKKNT